MGRSVLLVERDAELAESLKASLAEAGFEVRIVASAGAAVVAAMQRRPDVLVLDAELAGGEDAIAAARAIKRARGCRVLFHAERADADAFALIDERFEGSAELLQNPASGADIAQAVRRALASGESSDVSAFWEFELRHMATGRSVSAFSRDGETVEPSGGFDQHFPWDAHANSVREACFSWSRDAFEVLVTRVSRRED
jgi:DNA-binding response OmpR family regulator